MSAIRQAHLASIQPRSDVPGSASSGSGAKGRPKRGAFTVQLVLVLAFVSLAIVLAVTHTVLQVVNLRAAQGASANRADILYAALLATLPLILSGVLLGWLLALRLRHAIGALVTATARLHNGDFRTPIPPAHDVELAPLTEQMAQVRSYMESQAHSRIRDATFEEMRERALLASLRDPVITTSVNGRIVALNVAAVAIFGKLEQHYGRPVDHLLPFVVPPVADAPGRDDAAGPQTCWRGTTTDTEGRQLELEVSWTPLAEGNLIAADVYVVHNISRYAELSRLREQLVTDVTYEVRGPLTTLDNALQLLGTEPDQLASTDLAQLLGTARRSTERLRRLLADLALVRTIQSGHLALGLQPTPAASLLHDAIAAATATVTARGQRVECEAAPDLVARADPQHAAHLFANLLVNASNRAGDGEAIQIVAQPAHDGVRFTVSDRGSPMPPEQQSRLLGRVDAARPAGDEPGVGVELTIANGLVEAHGGQIGVDSRMDGGTRIWVTLPTASHSQGSHETHRTYGAHGRRSAYEGT